MSSETPAVKDIEDTLERHRARLEASVEKLRKALRQWQTHSAEYEGLKEGLLELSGNASRESMIEVGYGLDGTVVDSAEVLSLLREKSGINRSRDQVIQAINHRLAYVNDNITKVEKQLEKGEERLSGLLIVQGPEVLTEDGDPIIEIREDLDEEGNIISSSAQPHGKGKATAMNIDDLKQFQKYIENAAEEAKSLPHTIPSEESLSTFQEEILEQQEEQTMEINAEDLIESTTPTLEIQSVPVHEIRLDEPVSEDEASADNPTDQSSVTLIGQSEGPVVGKDVVIPNHRPIGGFVSGTQKPLQEQDFVLSVDEPPDAADLRRQMIDYNLHDIGAVVAEMDLEEDDYDDDDVDYDEDDDDEEDEEDEDKYGRTTRRVITADIEREMQALQARIRERQEEEESNKAKPQAKIELQNAAQVKISPEEGVPISKKKGVSFSNKLDVAIIQPQLQSNPQDCVLPPSPTLDDPDDAVPFLVDLLAREQLKKDWKNPGMDGIGATAQNDGWEVKTKDETGAQPKKVSRFKATRMNNQNGLQEQSVATPPQREPAIRSEILERQPETSAVPAPLVPITSDKSKKISRFKASKSTEAGAAATAANPPSLGIHQNTAFVRSTREGEEEGGGDIDDKSQPPRPLLAPTIIEKSPAPVTSSGNVPVGPSELDPAIHRQEVAVEYFKTRNKMIQKEGGFLPREEEEMYVPLDDGRKKVSRFKAARLGIGQTPPQ